MATDNREQLKRILCDFANMAYDEAESGKLDINWQPTADSILAIFAPEEPCTTFYAAIFSDQNDPWINLPTRSIAEQQKKQTESPFWNGHIIAIHVPDRLLQPRAATVTECKAEVEK